MLSTFMAIATIDRWGRRVGLYWGAIGQGISLILAGAFSRLLKDHSDRATPYGVAAAFFVFLYTAVFGATWVSIPWVYPTEIFPLEVRAKGNAFGVIGWAIGNACVLLKQDIPWHNLTNIQVADLIEPCDDCPNWREYFPRIRCTQLRQSPHSLGPVSRNCQQNS